MRSKREGTGFKEGTHELLPHSDTLDRLSEADFEFAHMIRREVGQLHLLEISPDPLVGIELGSVGRKILQAEALPVITHELPDGGGLVGSDVVPHQDDPAAHVAQQMPEEHEHLRGGDTSAAYQDVQLALRADARDGGELGPAGAVDDHRGLSPGSPGADACGDQAEAAFIREDQRGFLPADFFLTRGHSFWSQSWTFRSSRSRARPLGLWYDHPHCRRSLGT